MHKTAREAVDFTSAFLPQVRETAERVQIVVCAAFTAVPALSKELAESRVGLGAQDVHWDRSGAFTGAISAPMLAEFGVRYVIVGHSERREYFGDTDLTVRLKTAAALASGLIPIVAVGETLDIHDAGRTVAHVTAQVRAALEGLNETERAKILIAYEPIWAIGTGRNCNAAEANAVMAEIRGCVPGLANVPILYGGSVKPENIADYMTQPEIDGGLVGGASLDPTSFATLCKNAAPQAA